MKASGAVTYQVNRLVKLGYELQLTSFSSETQRDEHRLHNAMQRIWLQVEELVAKSIVQNLRGAIARTIDTDSNNPLSIRLLSEPEENQLASLSNKLHN